MFSACQEKTAEINLYTHRHYEVDKQLFAAFEEQTGIKVNVTNASADELIEKMEIEGDQSPADVLITVDAGRLVRAKEKELLQTMTSEYLSNTIPAHLRDDDNQWFGLTKRARVIAYSKERVHPDSLSTYEDLTSEKWKGKILIRQSNNIYNQSLLASIIAHHGEEGAKEWVTGMMENFARRPQGSDRDQVKAVMAGEGDLAIINTYYLGKLLKSSNPEEVAAGESVNIFFPNQEGRGAHVNISGAGVAKYSPNKENAIKFIEYLASKEVQKVFAQANYEYPVHPEVAASDLLVSWGEFKSDVLPLTKLGELNLNAVKTFNEAGWP
ncbi:MAG: Fe(3+) ABC transporter substrate-binding protein [Bacteroidota bacterium]